MRIEPFIEDLCTPHAIVREEDVQLILTPEPGPAPPAESLQQLEAAAMSAPCHTPGNVAIRAGRPLTLLAIIHDLDREPSCTGEWIVSATAEALRQAHWRGLVCVAMPLLGTVHGRLPPLAAARLLSTALGECASVHPEWLWLVDAPEDAVQWLQDRWKVDD